MIRTSSIKRTVYLFLISILITGCQDNALDSPPINEPGDILSLAELRSMYQGQTIKFEEPGQIYATVTMDESSGNIYRNIFVEDGTGGINVRLDFASTIKEGDRVRLSLKGAVLSSYNNMLQLDSVVFGKNLVQQGSAPLVEPLTVDIPQILEGGLQARLVKLQNVQFSGDELGSRFANVADGISENRTLTDCSNNRIIVRTSPFADFAHQFVPEGNGSLVAIVSQFGTTWQLILRSYAEMSMTGERCDTGEPSGNGTFDNPYNVAHGIAFNSGNGVWVEGYIVGVMEPSGTTNIPTFSPPFTIMSNIIIADDPDETDDSRIMPVQLPIGQARNALNLVSNPDNLGKQVKLKGNLAAYFVPRPGLREVSGYWIDGAGIGDGGIWDLLTPMTIKELRSLHTGSNVNIPDKRMIQGIVISDRENANIHGQNLHIIDEQDGTGVLIRFAATHSFEMGSKIRVDVSNITISLYNGLMQVGNIPLNQAELIGMSSIPPPEEASIAAILANMDYFESRLVRISDVSVSGGSTWGGSRTLNDGTGSITHFTTNYSSFANQPIPAAKVKLTGIVSVYNSPQINIRNLSDIE